MHSKFLAAGKKAKRPTGPAYVIQPDNGAGWWGLADLKTYQFSVDDKQTMETLCGNEKRE